MTEQYYLLERAPESPDFASSLQGLGVLDQGLCAVQPGRFTVVYGSAPRVNFGLWCSVMCQLTREQGGWGSPTVFVDGGNTFNPYFVSSLARKNCLSPRSALQGIFISRAFTAYQLTQLVFQRLGQALEEYQSQLAIISDLTTLFLDRDISPEEVEHIFYQLTSHLSQLTQKRNLAILVTHPPSNSKQGVYLQDILHQRADILVKIEENQQVLKLEVEKHPELESKPVQLPINSPVTLESFMEER
ncbi:MAG: hypothetical protein ACOC6G_02615 [Thermoproteota archaeon]